MVLKALLVALATAVVVAAVAALVMVFFGALIRDFAFVGGLVMLGAAIHHQPEYLSSLQVAWIAKHALLAGAFIYGACSGIDF